MWSDPAAGSHIEPDSFARFAQTAERGKFDFRFLAEGRDFAAASADATITGHSALEAGQAFYADVNGRLPRFGRTQDQLLILPAATFVLGDTDAEAAEVAREVRRAQVSPATALRFIEQLWNTELPDFDVDGPLPDFDPVVSDTLIAKGRASVRQFAKNPVALANE